MATIQEMLEAQGDYVVGQGEDYTSIAESLGLPPSDLLALNGGANLSPGMNINIPQADAPAYIPPGYNQPSSTLAPQIEIPPLPQLSQYQSGHLPSTVTAPRPSMYQSGHLPSNLYGPQGTGAGLGMPNANAQSGTPATGGTGMGMGMPGIGWQPTTEAVLDSPMLTWENLGSLADYAVESFDWVLNLQQGEQPETPNLESIREASGGSQAPTSPPSPLFPGQQPMLQGTGDNYADSLTSPEEAGVRNLAANYFRHEGERGTASDYELQVGYYNYEMINNAMAAGTRDLLPQYLHDRFVTTFYREFSEAGDQFSSMEEFYDVLGYESVGNGLWKKKEASSTRGGGSGGYGGGYGYARGYGYGYPSFTRGYGSAYMTPGLVDWRIGVE